MRFRQLSGGTMRLLAAGIAGMVMAFASAHYLFNGSAWNMIPWGVLAVLVGVAMESRRQALYGGAIYGYVLSFSFLWFDKTGSTSWPAFWRLLLVIALVSLFGALCGLLLSWLAFFSKKRFGA